MSFLWKGSSNQSNPSERLENLLKDTPIVDTHNDFPYLLRIQLHNILNSDPNFDFNDDKLLNHTSLPKIKKGRLGVQFFSAYIGCRYPDSLSQDFNYRTPIVRDTIEQIDVIERLIEKYDNDLKFAWNSDQALEIYRKEKKLAVTIGVEGLHQCDASIAMVRKYFDLGVRYITLTHNCDNPFATAASSVSAGLEDKGLTELGKECIAEMNRIGMLVDLSHVSYQTMIDTLEVTKSPVIFSHSSAYAKCPHLRNVPDDVLLKVKENKGVVQVNFYPAFLKNPEKNTEKVTIEDALDHIFHIAEVAGWDAVGLGSDFDGIDSAPEGLEDVSKYPDLLIKAIERGATDEQIRGLMGGNILRVWKENEVIAKKLQASGAPISESIWSERKWYTKSGAAKLPHLYEGSLDVFFKKDIKE
ncbi:renal dipeptidase family [Scheffersomyces amazonensis]|uniref:renal dipeptidase family n=1 Tax=Scheffersomyces amazonensis TaxID=1078765 RepID=UPI00315CE7EB